MYRPTQTTWTSPAVLSAGPSGKKIWLISSVDISRSQRRLATLKKKTGFNFFGSLLPLTSVLVNEEVPKITCWNRFVQTTFPDELRPRGMSGGRPFADVQTTVGRLLSAHIQTEPVRSWNAILDGQPRMVSSGRWGHLHGTLTHNPPPWKNVDVVPHSGIRLLFGKHGTFSLPWRTFLQS